MFVEAEDAAKALNLSDLDITKLIATTIADPIERTIHERLYIEYPALPGENIFDHAERALGEGSTTGLRAAIKRWRAQKALGFPPDYGPGASE